MGLQVRLRHALGERVLELPDRAVDDPIIVGRAGGADIQVPSINVGQRHLVLFVHEGQWVAQNGPDNTGTTINGSALPGVCVLQPGDMVELGTESSPPTIQIEAVSEGMSVAPPGLVSPPQPATAYGYAPAPPPPMPMGGYAPPPPHEPEPSTAADDAAGWMTGNVAPRTFYTPKRRKSSDAAIAFAVVLTIGILAGAGAYVYVQKQKATPKVVTVVQPPPTVEVPTSRPVPRSMFSEKAPPPAPKPKGPPPPPDLTDDVAEKPNVSIKRPATAGTAPVEPSKPAESTEALSPEADKAFKRVESLYWDIDPAKCLVSIDSFEMEFPGVNTPKLQQYREDMLDKAWWIRIDNLLDKQKELKAAIKKTEQDIKDETEQAFKKTVLEPRLEDQKARLGKVNERLTKEMNYKETIAPPIGEETKLQPLRAKRDRTIYDKWKAQVLKHVRNNHGAFPGRMSGNRTG